MIDLGNSKVIINNKEYDILYMCNSKKYHKKYVLYTDNSVNNLGEVNVYVCSYDKNGEELEEVKNEEELKEIENILNELQNI